MIVHKPGGSLHLNKSTGEVFAGSKRRMSYRKLDDFSSNLSHNKTHLFELILNYVYLVPHLEDTSKVLTYVRRDSKFTSGN
jgi:hypothetical protein